MSDQAVLIVDDKPAGRAAEVAEEVAEVTGTADAVHPEELSLKMIEESDLILVDVRLDWWTKDRDIADAERPSAERKIATRPLDGVALAAVIRSQLPKDDDRIRGVALLSANLTDLVRDFTPAATEHAAARFNGVEWAFDKTEIAGLPTLALRVSTLAAAVRRLSDQWPKVAKEMDRDAALYELLALADSTWREVAERDVHAAQAPLNQFGNATHGLSVLRWLGQRVLPYPTFLLDARRLAMACAISPTVIDDEPDGLKRLGETFSAVRYEGPLADFLGPRWWRAGVRHEVRELTGDTLPTPAVAKAVEERAGAEFPHLEPPGAVLEIDGALNVVGTVARERAVRIRPDDWPPFAETGWLSENRLKDHPDLLDLVDPVDRDRLGL
jgi:hypothetical protein